MQNIFNLLQSRIWLGPLILVLVLIAGLGLGLLVGWVVAPVTWTPSVDDVRAISDSYALNNDITLARNRLQNLSPTDQARLFNRIIVDSAALNRPIEAERATALAQALRLNLSTGTSTAPSTTPPSTTTTTSNPLTPILIGVGVLVVLALVGTAAMLFIRVGLPRLRTMRARAPIETEMESTGENEIQATAQGSAATASASASVGSLGRMQATYTAGMDNFDASYPLETQRQGFLGECGVGVSETVGDGLPDKVTAFDLWLFDKTDVRTVTHILMSEYAFNEPGVRAKLQTKGDAILASKNQVITLETQSLKVDARILDLAYASNPSLPPNSYFQRLVIEIATYLK